MSFRLKRRRALSSPLVTDPNIDVHNGLEIVRVLGHGWVILIGLISLIPVQSTETRLLTEAGFPYWSLGSTLLAGSVWLIVARLLNNWLLFVIGDVIVGTMCIAIAIMMLIAATHGLASGISTLLWVLPASLFMLHAVLRARWK